MAWRWIKNSCPEDVKKLVSRIEQAHQEGIRVRLWNAPDFSNAWTQLIKLQVDYINTDHIEGLAEYLGNRY